MDRNPNIPPLFSFKSTPYPESKTENLKKEVCLNELGLHKS